MEPREVAGGCCYLTPIRATSAVWLLCTASGSEAGGPEESSHLRWCCADCIGRRGLGRPLGWPRRRCVDRCPGPLDCRDPANCEVVLGRRRASRRVPSSWWTAARTRSAGPRPALAFARASGLPLGRRGPGVSPTTVRHIGEDCGQGLGVGAEAAPAVARICALVRGLVVVGPRLLRRRRRMRCRLGGRE